MSGTISDERVVKVPASEAWKFYSTLHLANYVQEALPALITKIDVIEGDGTAGTIIEIFFAPGMEGGLNSYKEKLTVVDDEKRVKVAEVVEGGCLDLGFNLYRDVRSDRERKGAMYNSSYDRVRGERRSRSQFRHRFDSTPRHHHASCCRLSRENLPPK